MSRAMRSKRPTRSRPRSARRRNTWPRSASSPAPIAAWRQCGATLRSASSKRWARARRWHGRNSADVVGRRRGLPRRRAVLGARGRVQHLELFRGRNVVGLVGDHVDDPAAGALLGLVHELLQVLGTLGRTHAHRCDLLAGVVLILARIGKNRERIVVAAERRTCTQKTRSDAG